MEVRLSAHGAYQHQYHVVWISKYRRGILRRAMLWSPGFFSSTVGLNEAVIRRYVEHQERVDKGHMQLKFEF